MDSEEKSEIDSTLDIKEDNIFDAILVAISTALFALTILLASTQVFVRNIPYVSGFTWTEPMARFILIIGTFIGGAVVTRNREHIKIDIVLNQVRAFSDKAYKVLVSINGLILSIFLIVAVYTTINATFVNWDTSLGGGQGYVTSGMLYLFITIGLVLTLIFEVINVVEDVRGGTN